MIRSSFARLAAALVSLGAPNQPARPAYYHRFGAKLAPGKRQWLAPRGRHLSGTGKALARLAWERRNRQAA